MAESNYKNIVLSDGPVGYWKFDADDFDVDENLGSIAGYDGAYSNTTSTFSFVDPTGEAQYFGGTNSYAQLGTYSPPVPNAAGAIHTSESVTIEGWISLSGRRYTSLENKVVFSNAHYNDTLGTFLWNYMLYVDKYNKINFKVNNTIEVVTLESTRVLEENRTYHIVVTTQDNEHRLYIDGYLDIRNTALTDSSLVYDPTWPLHVGDIKSVIGGSTSGVGTYWSPTEAGWGNFNGTIDELAVYDKVLSASRIKQHYDYGFGGNFVERLGDKANYEVMHRVRRYDVKRSYSEAQYEFCGNFEKSPLFVEGADATSYFNYIKDALKPDFWYTIDTAAPNVSETNHAFGSGGGPVLTYYNAAIQSQIVGALTNNGANYAKDFDGRDGYAQINGLDLGAPDNDNPFTIAFWYKQERRHFGDSRHVIGFQHLDREQGEGFHIAIDKNNRMLFQKDSGGDTFTVKDPREREVDDMQSWHHYIVTVSPRGRMVMYRNGSAIAEESSDGLGLIKPDAASVFSISNSDWELDKPNMSLDDLFMLNRQIDSFEASLLYRVSRDGTVEVNVTAGSDIDFDPKKVRVARFDTLINEKDISGHVVSYVIERDIDQPVSQAVLQVTESFLATETKELLKANTYLTVEERYVDVDDDYDSGWLSVGHFMVDGPVGTDVEAEQGGKMMNIRASSVAKLMSLDIATIDVEPDIIDVTKRSARLKLETQNTFRFGMRRAGSDDDGSERDKWYRNWADTPAVRLWVSQFTAFTDDAERDLLDAQSGEELRIKGSGGSIQVLFGEGVVIIDRDYYEDPVADNGLGNPDNTKGGVKLAFRRFATNEDLVDVEVLNLETVNGRTFVTFNGDVYEGDGKSIIVKSGDAKGRFYKIWETA